MKRKIIEALMIVHMMVLLAACGKLDEENLLSTPAAESETTASSESQKDAPTKTPEQVSKGEVNDPYQEDGIGFRFVTQEEFEEIVDDTDLSYWSLEEDETKSGTTDSLHTEVLRYTLYSKKNKYLCFFTNGLSTYGNGTVSVQIYWNESDDMTVEEHNSLKKDGIPELWTLIGKLSEDEEAIKTLKALWDSRYQKHVAYYSKDILGYFCSWGMQHEGIYVTTLMTDQEPVKQPMLNGLDFKNEREYNHTGNVDKNAILTVEELLSLAPDEDNLAKNHLVQGKLSGITEDADVDFSNLKGNEPSYDNLYDCRKANLIDESGSAEVIISPTALTEGELGAERLHVVTILKDRYTDDVTYLIQKSCIYEED